MSPLSRSLNLSKKIRSSFCPGISGEDREGNISNSSNPGRKSLLKGGGTNKINTFSQENISSMGGAVRRSQEEDLQKYANFITPSGRKNETPR